MARYFITGVREEYILSQWITSVMIAVYWALGVAILVGGQVRFSLPTYEPLVDLSGGHTWIWGVVVIVAAILTMIPVKGLSVSGLWLGTTWMITWAVMFAVSIVQDPLSAATPAVAYAGFAMINAALLTARVIEKPSAVVR